MLPIDFAEPDVLSLRYRSARVASAHVTEFIGHGQIAAADLDVVGQDSKMGVVGQALYGFRGK